MKIKKSGFTLIEIIICIAMLAIISVGSVVGINLVNKSLVKKGLEQITDKAIKATQVYIETNNDAQNQIYEKQNALYLPIKVLVNEGLLSLKGTNLSDKDIKNKYTITALSTPTGNEKDCVDISTKTSWDDSKAIYICTYNKANDGNDGSTIIGGDTTIINNLITINSNQYIAKGANPNNWVNFDSLSKRISYTETTDIKFRILSIDKNKINLIVADELGAVKIGRYRKCENISINSWQSMASQLNDCYGIKLNSNCFVEFKNFTISIINSQQIAAYTTLRLTSWDGGYDTTMNARIILYHEIQNTYDDGASWLPTNFFYGYTQFRDTSGYSNLFMNLVKDSDGHDSYLYPIFALKLGENVELVEDDCSKNGNETSGTEECPYKINIKNNYCELD